MRIRSTKPEFWRSERIAAVSWDARLVLKGLESYVDDNGVGKDDVALVVADVFPRDMIASPRETYTRVSASISELADAGLVHRYEHDGTRLLFVSFWETVQRIDRPSRGRFRRPDGSMDFNETRIGTPNREPSRALDAGTGEQRNRGTEENPSCPTADAAARDASTHTDTTTERTDAADADDRFEEFWETYDHKVGKKAARQKWKIALRKVAKDGGADLLISAAASYVASVKATGKHPQFTKHPATWLNGEHWRDERPAGAPGAPAPSGPRRTAAQCPTTTPHPRHDWERGPNRFGCMGVEADPGRSHLSVVNR